MAYKIVIDPGHGGFDDGAVYKGRLEKDDNLNLAQNIGELLAYNGFDVIFTRTDDTYLSPLERTFIANEEKAELFVSVHRNSCPVPNTYRGVKSLIGKESEINRVIAENINRELSKLGFPDLGVDTRNELAVLRRTNMPALLVETGFINADRDNELFDSHMNQIAYGICAGIINGLQTGNDTGPVYRVQVGLFRVLSNAQSLQNSLINAGYDVLLVPQGDYFAVQVGGFSNMDDAAMLEQRLREQGYSTLIVRDDD
ncbi:MAG: Sporulation-specific N-acetylmuramoyl-L-alanine amidase [Lachnoclostridium sp.]|jgi:N-acetylmuramoyl-L-alanine amidase